MLDSLDLDQANFERANMLQIQPGFAVPLGFGQLQDSAQLNSALKALFLKRETEGARWANPNPYTHRNQALYESHFDLFKWPEPEIQRLKAFCWQKLLEMVGRLNNYSPDYLQRLRIGADAWFHITRRGGQFGIHNHPMASWSGVYCVAGGQHDQGRDDSGLLTFINPFIMTTMFVDAGTAQMAEPYSISSRSYRLEAGQLVLFPSWLLHEVKPFHGEGERITVAFNTWFHPPAQQ
jgi:uncharacterized protein (TIGR02466 family)